MNKIKNWFVIFLKKYIYTILFVIFILIALCIRYGIDIIWQYLQYNIEDIALRIIGLITIFLPIGSLLCLDSLIHDRTNRRKYFILFAISIFISCTLILINRNYMIAYFAGLFLIALDKIINQLRR